ncbi:hypothetical protein [uncultured Fusobacterium sp.]|uniref:hypothetical protein n=1 Tax=uncultured Fusobacterium sp. TaxID=159267 RepID=UPI0025CF524D|nr:hypothetical protein [uncultured Fusobacterium sp.]
MEINIVLIIGIAIIVGGIILYKFQQHENNFDIDDKMCFYYRFAGDIEWLKVQLEKYRFESLKYLFSCKNKEESDFYIAIGEIENEITVSFYATEFNYSKKNGISLLVENLKLNEDQYEELIDSMKDTYMEDRKKDHNLMEKSA